VADHAKRFAVTSRVCGAVEPSRTFRRQNFRYASGERAPLPVAQFVGHRVDGSLSVEREGTDHPGVTRATGLFDAAVFPEPCRDAEEIRQLLADPTA